MCLAPRNVSLTEQHPLPPCSASAVRVIILVPEKRAAFPHEQRPNLSMNELFLVLLRRVEASAPELAPLVDAVRCLS